MKLLKNYGVDNMNNKIILKLQEFAEKDKDKYALIELDNTKDTFKAK